MEAAVTLPILLGEWIKNDPLLIRHFSLWDHKQLGKYYTKPEWAGEIYHDCRWPKKVNASDQPGLHTSYVAARIFDDRICVMFAQHVIYKFQAVHPMFFQKLRGHLYDQHNRHHASCSDYLR